MATPVNLGLPAMVSMCPLQHSVASKIDGEMSCLNSWSNTECNSSGSTMKALTKGASPSIRLAGTLSIMIISSQSTS